MRIVFENRITELDESDASEKRRLEVRVSFGGFGVGKEAIIEMMADISDKILEMSMKDGEIEPEEATEDMEIDSIHNKFETDTEGKEWFR